jgi:hypothetical protein
MDHPIPPKNDFQREEKERLSTYKREILGVVEDGIWARNGRAYQHILPVEKRRLNILPAFCNEFWTWLPVVRTRLHRDFHHLNSSQALCFNLFFPLLRENGQGLPALLNSLNVAGAPASGAMFEFEPDSDEGTCFDFMLPLQSGRRGRLTRVHFDIKYTESGFGAAKLDDEHLFKFNRIYEPRLVGRFEKKFCCAFQFLKNYQILRNVWHLDQEAADIVIFLLPKANARLRRAEPIIESCALEPFRSRIKIVYLEDLIPTLERELNKTTVGEAAWLAQFRRKYLPSQRLLIESCAPLLPPASDGPIGRKVTAIG